MNRQASTIGIAVAVVLLIGVAAYFVLHPASRGTHEAPPITGAERAEQARGVISEIKASGDAVDYDATFEQAEAFRKAGQLADAQLLYFYAARAKHGPSAFALASMNDPNHHSADTSFLPHPDAFQAYKWYSVARAQGMPAAAERLDALHQWAEKAAQSGDAEAERLLLQWK